MMNKEELLNELERMRENQIRMINNECDNFKRLLTGQDIEPVPVSLITTPSFFIGKKPTMLHIDFEEIPVKSWREVASVLLSRCNEESHSELRNLCDRVSGKSRIILASSGSGMDKPVKIDEDIYFEGHFGTEYMLTMLIRILNYAHFDYDDIMVSVK